MRIAILAQIRSLNMRVNEVTNGHEKKMDEARYYMLQNMGVEIYFEELAELLGRPNKDETGFLNKMR